MKSTLAVSILLATFHISVAQAMEMHTCGDQLVLSGDVERGDFQHIEDALAGNANVSVAVLRNSRGGDAQTGYEVGAFFRDKGISTYVSGYCRSSCSRMFLGGKNRFFTDDFPASRTSVGFHSNYNNAGGIVSGAPRQLHQFIAKYSDGKADEALVDRWVNIPNRNGFAHFFHPATLKRHDQVSILLCKGNEPSDQHWVQCEKIAGHDALSMGIITSLDIKRSCDADALAAQSAQAKTQSVTDDAHP